VHDPRQSLTTAVAEVFPGTRQFVCHYHFAADVGKDILTSHIDRLRQLFRRTKVRPKLRALCRSLKKFAAAEGNGELVLSSVLAVRSTKDLRGLSSPEAIKGTVHALASWILAFSHSGDGYGFPFDVPYLTFYDRILDTYEILCQVSVTWPVKKRGPLGTGNSQTLQGDSRDGGGEPVHRRVPGDRGGNQKRPEDLRSLAQRFEDLSKRWNEQAERRRRLEFFVFCPPPEGIKSVARLAQEESRHRYFTPRLRHCRASSR
jgi:hypothetical protein